jgi:uncharacterized protein (DUF2062 family)
VDGVGCVGGVGVWGHSLRSTFHRLHFLRLWTPMILGTRVARVVATIMGFFADYAFWQISSKFLFFRVTLF